MASEQLAARQIVDGNGMPTPYMWDFMRRLLTVDTELSQLSGDADNLADGITRRIRDIAKEEITYNSDGTIDTVTYKDHATDDVLLTESVGYNPNQTIDTVVAVDSQARTTTQTISYDELNLINIITPSFVGYG